MSYNNQELQAFLVQAELVNQKVKALAENRLSPQQFDHLQRLRQQDKQKKQNFKLKKKQQYQQSRINGHQGKGITKDFKHFCKACRWEYQFQTPTCLKCKRRTMTLEQRQKQLDLMVSIYKDKKKDRQSRKHRWDMWQKTQATLWKKNNINYSKWEYFISDSEEQPEQDPIVPKNDPNFMALQMDLEQRKKRKAKDHIETKKLKQKGNKLMQEGNYQQAMHKYTLALEHAKDIKSVYTNRALAFIKLGKFKKAIKDCSNVIEYMEIFQKIGQNKDLTFKAYSRRAIARKQIKQYKIALQDIQQALKLYPQDKNAILLKKQLQGLKNHTDKVEKILKQNSNTKQNQNIKQNSNMQQKEPENKNQQLKQHIKQKQNDDQQMNQDKDQKQYDEQVIRAEQKQIVRQLAQQQLQKQKQQSNTNQSKQNISSQNKKVQSSQNKAKQKNINIQKPQIKINLVQTIKKLVKDLKPQSIKDLFSILANNQDMRSIFIATKGIQACLKLLTTSQFSNQQALIISLCLSGNGVGQKAVWDFGIDKIHNRIEQLLLDKTNQKQHTYQIMEDLLQILIAVSLNQTYRIKLSNDMKVQNFIESTYTKVISKRKNRTHLLNFFIIYMSNLLSGADSGLKNNFFNKQKFTTLIDSFFVLILDEKSQNRTFLELKKNVFGLIANMATHVQHRKTIVDFFSKNKKFHDLTEDLLLYPKSMQNFTQYIQAILSILVNTTLQTNLELPQLSDVLFSRFIKNRKIFSKEIIYRSLVVLSRLKYQSLQIGKKWLPTFQDYALQQEPLKSPQQKSNMIQIVRILNLIYTPTQKVDGLTAQLPQKLLLTLCKYISSNLDHENLFCNTANLFGVIVMSQNPSKQKIYTFVAEQMKHLVYVSKERTGNWRKNAAILIAKCSSNPKVKQSMEKQHAMDVLKSIAHLVQTK